MRQTLEQPASGESSASLYDDVTARIIRELEHGTLPWIKPWKDACAPLGLPRNATTQRAYTGVNVLAGASGSTADWSASSARNAERRAHSFAMMAWAVVAVL